MNKKNDDSLALLEVKLNDENIVNAKWYRRNSIAYPLVCYVNNIIALRLSGNKECIPVFIMRARKFIKSNYSASLNEVYIAYVTKYLDQLETTMDVKGSYDSSN